MGFETFVSLAITARSFSSADSLARLSESCCCSESNTGFGKHVAAYGENAEIVVLRFPLHVSRLKSEYAQLFRKRRQLLSRRACAASTTE